MAVLIVGLQLISCLGYGALLLRMTGTQDTLRADEQIAWALGLGSGVIGWLMFFVGVGGLFTEAAYTLVLALGLAGTIYVKDPLIECGKSLRDWRPGRGEIVSLGALGLFGALSLAGALVPPTDADSLAYHFYLPKYFDSLGRIEFVPRAVDGAAPLLAQMAYLPVYGLGGEKALTIWVMANGWISAFLLFSLSRRFLSPEWSLVTTLLFITVPAYVYGAGAGQVEVRISIFVMIAAFSLSAAVRTGLVRHAVVCGIAVGFFMGSKYTGLLFALACGLIIVIQRRWFIHGAVLTGVSVLVGSQWYIWNMIHTGDPVFPMMFELLKDAVDYRYWDALQHRIFVEQYLNIEKSLDITITNFFGYPFIATFFDLEGLESSRTGLGPYGFVALPFAVLGMWFTRHRVSVNALLIVGGLAFLFCAIWFFAGSPQRVRHLLPIYPVILLVVSVAAVEGARKVSSVPILACGIVITLIIQFGGTALFSFGNVRHLIGANTRSQYIGDRVSGYSAVEWINGRLRSTDHVYIEQRELAYLIKSRVYLGHPLTQSLVKSHALAGDPQILRRQLLDQGISHFLLPTVSLADDNPLGQLVALGCINVVKSFKTKTLRSRTLEAFQRETTKTKDMSFAKLRSTDC